MRPALLAACAALVLGACSEKPQVMASEAGQRKADVPAWNGAPNDPFMAKGWKPGTIESWEQQLKSRAQGQNEYVRVGKP